MREIHVMDEIKLSQDRCLRIDERWLHRLIGDNGDEKIGARAVSLRKAGNPNCCETARAIRWFCVPVLRPAPLTSIR
jgi:hypothetical protein